MNLHEASIGLAKTIKGICRDFNLSVLDAIAKYPGVTINRQSIEQLDNGNRWEVTFDNRIADAFTYNRIPVTVQINLKQRLQEVTFPRRDWNDDGEDRPKRILLTMDLPGVSVPGKRSV